MSITATDVATESVHTSVQRLHKDGVAAKGNLQEGCFLETE